MLSSFLPNIHKFRILKWMVFFLSFFAPTATHTCLFDGNMMAQHSMVKIQGGECGLAMEDTLREIFPVVSNVLLEDKQKFNQSLEIWVFFQQRYWRWYWWGGVFPVSSCILLASCIYLWIEKWTIAYLFPSMSIYWNYNRCFSPD